MVFSRGKLNLELKEKPFQESVTGTAPTGKEKFSRYRNLVAFWLFGLCNNFSYVVMLSAAHDILKEEDGTSSSNSTEKTFTNNANASLSQNLTNAFSEASNVTYLECNKVSTGAILLADILPTLAVKLTFPFFLEKIPYNVKIPVVSAFALGSFLMVALAHEMWLSILGVVFASISSGIGELAFLSLTTFYNRNVVSMWSSGTGGAGIFGSLVYAGFTSAGLSPRNSLLIMVTIPVLMIVAYFIILTTPESEQEIIAVEIITSKQNESINEEKQKIKSQLTLKEKFKLIPNLLKYMVPLILVYFGEYFINQGLHELLYFNGQWLSKSEQYRWYQVDYQIGVFISRSSVQLFHIKKLWILPVLQFVNLALLLCQVFYRFIPSIWIIFVIVLWEGLLGGAAYVNTFYRITNEIAPGKKEYSIAIVAMADSFGITAAGATSIPSHNAICGMKLTM